MPTRAHDFRYIYSNAVGLGLNDSEVRLMFGMAEDMTRPEDSAEQVGIVLNHKTAKMMVYMLKETLEHYERTVGQEIPFDRERFEQLKASTFGGLNPPSTAMPQPFGQSLTVSRDL